MNDTCKAWRPSGTFSSLNRPSRSAVVTRSGKSALGRWRQAAGSVLLHRQPSQRLRPFGPKVLWKGRGQTAQGQRPLSFGPSNVGYEACRKVGIPTSQVRLVGASALRLSGRLERHQKERANHGKCEQRGLDRV